MFCMLAIQLVASRFHVGSSVMMTQSQQPQLNAMTDDVLADYFAAKEFDVTTATCQWQRQCVCTQ